MFTKGFFCGPALERKGISIINPGSHSDAFKHCQTHYKTSKNTQCIHLNEQLQRPSEIERLLGLKM